jgi:hypothetical protein
MALKRLDEEFELKPGTQLLPYMKRLLPSLEGRFQSIEADQDVVQQLTDEIRASALLRMNEILIPATKDIVEVTKLGFLLAPISTPYKFVLGYMAVYVDEGAQRDTFTPSPYLIVEHTQNDYCIARLIGYEQETGLLEMTVTATHGNMGPWDDWMVSSTPGMADSTKLYHDAIAPMHTEVVADTEEVRTLHAEVLAAAQALAESGLDVYAFIRRDGTVPFVATQTAIAPVAGSNDATIPTTAWTRSRIIEYAGNAVNKLGDTMSGPLYLSAAITQPLQAATKAYVDDSIVAPHIVNDSLTISGVGPALKLRPSAAQQNRTIQALNTAGAARWTLTMADSALETGGNAGANFSLSRYTDLGALIDNPLAIDRATGTTTVKSLSFNGTVNGVGPINLIGDINLYRANAPTTGALYLNQAKSAYHFFDGATHILAGGGLSTSGGAISCGAINGVGAISTNGYPTTTWGLTCHGTATVNGAMNSQGIQVTSAGPLITMYDNTWGPMHVHHQDGNIGFLNHNGGWVWYVNYNGHYWSPQYGWLHDYVTGTANNYAWNAANYRYSQVVQTMRFAYTGDMPTSWPGSGIGEPWNAQVTGWAGYNGYNMYVTYFRFRQGQVMINGGWYAVGFA